MSADQPPNPYGPEGRSGPRRYYWSLVVVGAVIGFVLWVGVSVLVVIATGFAEPVGTAPWLAIVVLGAIFVLAVASIVWPRTRRLGQGIILGLAIGMVVAGGLCIPLLIGA